MKFDRHKFFQGFRDKIDETIEQEQVDGLEFLLTKMEADPFWKDLRHIAYALATAGHETAWSFQPVTEGYYLAKTDPPDYAGNTARVKRFQKTLRYYPYHGRGYVQLTWKTNYEKAGKILSMDLVNKPQLALDREGAYLTMTYGMHQGWFTTKKLTDYISDTGKDYKNARKIINGLDKAALIANYATAFENILRDSKTSTAAHTASNPDQPTDTSENKGSSPAEQPSSNTIKAEITSEGAVTVEKTDGPPAPKERIAVVQTKPQKWSSRIAAKITGMVSGNVLFQWIWAQIEKIQGLSVPDAVWVIVSVTIAIGSLLWIVYEIISTWRGNKYQETIDSLLVKENSTSENLVQLIPSDEVELYRVRGFKIITRGEKA